MIEVLYWYSNLVKLFMDDVGIKITFLPFMFEMSHDWLESIDLGNEATNVSLVSWNIIVTHMKLFKNDIYDGLHIDFSGLR